MNDRPDYGQEQMRVGLCADCRHSRVIASDRGSEFWLCERSRTDPAYPRFPGLPVRVCAGYEPGVRPQAPIRPPD